MAGKGCLLLLLSFFVLLNETEGWFGMRLFRRWGEYGSSSSSSDSSESAEPDAEFGGTLEQLRAEVAQLREKTQHLERVNNNLHARLENLDLSDGDDNILQRMEECMGRM